MTTNLEQRLDHYIHEQMQHKHIPGLSLAVIQDSVTVSETNSGRRFCSSLPQSPRRFRKRRGFFLAGFSVIIPHKRSDRPAYSHPPTGRWVSARLSVG